MAWLFDTSAISEVFRPRPDGAYLQWLGTLPRDQQFTSAVVLGELYAGAWASPAPERWLERIDAQVLPRLTVLPVDLGCAATYGRLRAHLRLAGTPIGDADTLIAATALHHGLGVVTATLRHFDRVPDLAIRPVRPT